MLRRGLLLALCPAFVLASSAAGQDGSSVGLRLVPGVGYASASFGDNSPRSSSGFAFTLGGRSVRFQNRFPTRFGVQEEIARNVAAALEAELTPGEDVGLAEVPTGDLEAYNLYLKGRYAFNQRTTDGINTAADYFRQAIARDSTYALAYVGLADVYLALRWYAAMPRSEAAEIVEPLIAMALELDSTLGPAYTSRGLLNRWRENTATAERDHLRAIELSPRDANAYHWYALALTEWNRFDEALYFVRQAEVLDPISAIIANNIAWIFETSGDTTAALGQYERALDLDPNFAELHRSYAWLLRALGRTDEALEEIRRAHQLDPDGAHINKELTLHLFSAGYEDEAIEQCKITRELYPDWEEGRECPIPID